MTMTDTEFSRRAMLTVTAAGVALAGCKPTGSEVTAKALDCPLNGTGLNPSYGDEPNAELPADVVYNPKFMTLVRISSKGVWDFSVNQASFPVPALSIPSDPTKDEQNRLYSAVSIFEKLNGRQFAALDPTNDKIIKRKSGKYDAIDFDDFNFGHQHDIYIWFDAKDKVVLHKTAAGASYLIEMSPMRADGSKTNPNKSFYATDVSAKTAKLGGQMILVRNCLRDDNGKPSRDAKGTWVGAPYFKYSMNIIFELIRKDSKNLVVILDPDTGNGTGYDPFTNT